MSEEVLIRLVLVGAVAGLAVLGAWMARRGTAVSRRPVLLRGHGPGVVFFSSATCGTCEVMRRRLEGTSAVEVSYEASGPEFPPEVRRVPAVAMLDAEGRGWIAHGVVGEARLRRWLAERSLDG